MLNKVNLYRIKIKACFHSNAGDKPVLELLQLIYIEIPIGIRKKSMPMISIAKHTMKEVYHLVIVSGSTTFASSSESMCAPANSPTSIIAANTFLQNAFDLALDLEIRHIIII
jgi:hypothetical protein